MNKKIQVIVAEDQAMVLGALAALLETESDIAVCARGTEWPRGSLCRRKTLAGCSGHRH